MASNRSPPLEHMRTKANSPRIPRREARTCSSAQNNLTLVGWRELLSYEKWTGESSLCSVKAVWRASSTWTRWRSGCQKEFASASLRLVTTYRGFHILTFMVRAFTSANTFWLAMVFAGAIINIILHLIRFHPRSRDDVKFFSVRGIMDTLILPHLI
ncbi:hypothetical protein BDDG_04456 [Blastomyces dermatitidis ATCC 18188]|uniref:Uncharacterized protein n=1 Tax=Ajellomyces dermatitidis (strain ATCC 18188 / CBS 674.68) TaxID=653446 RepID=F2TE51_AJEDA|nr:hypothetical protein BDDG_04456 [Blastomyces dermatitidis ATCC 18188]